MPPEKLILEKLVRNILNDKPRVTKIPIIWDTNSSKDIETEEDNFHTKNNSWESHNNEINV